MGRIFDTDNVILVKVNDEDINSWLIDKDLCDDGQYRVRLNEFAEAVMNTVPEYAFAEHSKENITSLNARKHLVDAAKSIYKIKEYDLMRRIILSDDSDTEARDEYDELSKKYTSRGEFGELILHLLLRDFKETIPLISKVYFSDAPGVPAHGFDAVHITPNEKILWLGESKVYGNVNQGVSALVDDVKKHFTIDYLNEQFLIIKRGLETNDIPMRDEWIQILNNCNKLEEKFSIINIPLLCVYNSNIYIKFDNFSEVEAEKFHFTEISKLKKKFDELCKLPNRNRLNIVLFLFPVDNKNDLLKILHEKLWSMQNM